jgi:hypothetical protein
MMVLEAFLKVSLRIQAVDEGGGAEGGLRNPDSGVPDGRTPVSYRPCFLAIARVSITSGLPRMIISTYLRGSRCLEACSNVTSA